MNAKFIAIDQYGGIRFIQEHPRKELMEYFGVSHADKVYVDTKTGEAKHIGYVVAGHWYEIMKLESWKSES